MVDGGPPQADHYLLFTIYLKTMKKLIITLFLLGGVFSLMTQVWARSMATGVISYVAPVYMGGTGWGDGASLNMDGGDEYIIVQDSNGNYAGCSGSGTDTSSWSLSLLSTYGYVRPDHPNKKELYTLFLTSRAMNQEITCVYENAHSDDPGGCIIVYCSL